MQPKGKKTLEQKLKSNIAKARKEAVRLEKEQKRNKEIEDQQWIESDKLVLRKLQRKQIKVQKRNEQIKRKVQSKNMIEAELNEIKGYQENNAAKVSADEQIEETIEMEEELNLKLTNNKIIKDRPELFINLNRLQPTEPISEKD